MIRYYVIVLIAFIKNNSHINSGDNNDSDNEINNIKIINPNF